ncbi:hypothetical protein ACFOM9_06340 [Luteimonas notoginsengisoli]|uniref:Tetratricopeptide repeat protein n=2 Tax=Luteimonas notoginsengisoli TaxID=1578200 RepID=A0ABV7UT86_9GAMM
MIHERDMPNDPDAQGADFGDGRREPGMGSLRGLDFARRERPRRLPRMPARGWPWLLGCVLLAAVLLVMAMRKPLADWLWPQTRAQALRAQAAQALAQGRLTAADGSGARELYAAALAIDPDRDEARAGLAEVAEAALAQARQATAQDRFADAHASLRLARSLSVPRADAAAVATALRKREAAHAGIPGLLKRAEAARESGQLTGNPDAALPLYQRILALQPENTRALEGREDALGELLQQARAQLREGRLAEATAAIDAARSFDPGHVDLPDTQARLNEELDDVRRNAASDLRDGRLERAAERYRLLAAAGQQADADAGLERVAVAWAHRAETMAADFRFAAADAALAQARALAPEITAVSTAGQRVARAQQAHARLGSQVPPRERGRRVARLLAEAKDAEARGDLLAPPGDSAFDKLRAARAIAPDDPAVRKATARLLPAAKQCFERGLSANNLGLARACFDARVALETDAAALASARRRLAGRWLAIGDERLGAGELRGASAALSSARALDPATPGLDDFDRRIRAATAPQR